MVTEQQITLFYTFDLIGTFVFALSGALLGVHKRMDVYSIFILALVTSVGGGTLRDMMLARTPPFYFTDLNYLYSIVLAFILVFFFEKK